MSDSSEYPLAIRTSSNGWLTSLAKAYKTKTSLMLIDDANIGVDPLRDTLLDMGRKANLSVREWIAVLFSLGMGAVGAYLLVMAIIDPEPFSKISAALAAGTFLVASGGFTAIHSLTGHKPPNVELGPKGGFKISFA